MEELKQNSPTYLGTIDKKKWIHLSHLFSFADTGEPKLSPNSPDAVLSLDDQKRRYVGVYILPDIDRYEIRERTVKQGLSKHFIDADGYKAGCPQENVDDEQDNDLGPETAPYPASKPNPEPENNLINLGSLKNSIWDNITDEAIALGAISGYAKNRQGKEIVSRTTLYSKPENLKIHDLMTLLKKQKSFRQAWIIDIPSFTNEDGQIIRHLYI